MPSSPCHHQLSRVHPSLVLSEIDPCSWSCSAHSKSCPTCTLKGFVLSVQIFFGAALSLTNFFHTNLSKYLASAEFLSQAIS